MADRPAPRRSTACEPSPKRSRPPSRWRMGARETTIGDAASELEILAANEWGARP